LLSIAKLYGAMHCRCQLSNNVETYAAAAAARMPHKKLAHTSKVTLESEPVVGKSNAHAAALRTNSDIDLSRATVRQRILDQVRQHAFRRPRIGHDFALPAQSEGDVGPMMPQSINSTADADGLEKEFAARQIYQKQ